MLHQSKVVQLTLYPAPNACCLPYIKGLEKGLGPSPPASAKDVNPRHVRKFVEINAIDEILAATIFQEQKPVPFQLNLH
jgi:hypothetical protein